MAKRLRRAWSYVLIGGLVTILLLLAAATNMFRHNKANWINRLVIRLSKYRRLASYIIAQARHETANFTSTVYRKDNNMFGMKVAKKRRQLGTGPGTMARDGSSYQHYRSDTQSLRDLFVYFDYVNFPTQVNSSREYVAQLKTRGFFTDDQIVYLKAIDAWLRKNVA